jgi:hypothetical protein
MISEDKAKRQMNCGEAVKPEHYAVEAARKPVLKRKHRPGKESTGLE